MLWSRPHPAKAHSAVEHAPKGKPRSINEVGLEMDKEKEKLIFIREELASIGEPHDKGSSAKKQQLEKQWKETREKIDRLDKEFMELSKPKK